jgi:tetratricopeptide (TPR) repeat protein
VIQYETLIQECENAIRNGEIALAARKLGELNYSHVPREWRLALAKLSRRSGLFSSGLKFLTPVIQASDKKLKLVPTAEELAEYGACLQINGSINEAIQVLNRIPHGQVPEALLYQAWCCFTRWEYAEAIPFLEKYFSSDLTPYWKVVGSVNLAAALSMLRNRERALEIINFALHETKNGDMVRLHANCLELRAQVYVQSEEYSKAELDLNEALRLLGLAQVQETLFIKKWRAVVEATKSRSIEPFIQLKEEAKKLSRWEILREADLFSLKIKFDQSQFEQVIFGTPYPAYHQRVSSELNCRVLPTHAILGNQQGPCFDVESGEIDGRLLFKPGCKTHQALEVILRDFYRPVGVGGLFSEIFPGEPFNIFSSPGRIHQILRRTRQWLRETNLPLNLVEQNGYYSLVCEGPFSFRVPRQKESLDWCRIQYRKLVELEPTKQKKLSPASIKKLLGLTQDEYRRLSTWAIEQGYLRRVYDGSLPLLEFAS